MKLSLIDFLLISRPYLHFPMTPKLQLIAIKVVRSRKLDLRQK